MISSNAAKKLALAKEQTNRFTNLAKAGERSYKVLTAAQKREMAKQEQRRKQNTARVAKEIEKKLAEADQTR